jgi:hypothetical protein
MLVQSADAARQPIFPYWDSVSEWPADVQVFVTEARRILGYLKHYGEEQRPPKSIWHSARKCEAWIKEHDPFKKENSGRGNTIDLLDSERE